MHEAARVGPPDARKRACPVRGGLGGNLLLRGSKASSFYSIPRSGRDRPPLPPHTCLRSGPGAGMGSGCTGVPALSETPVGCHRDGESLSSRTICAPWRYAPDPTACWLLASAGLRGRHTSPLSSPETNAGHAHRWPSPPWWRRGRQSGVTVGRAPTRAGSCAVVLGTTACGTASGVPYGEESRWLPVSS